MGHVARIGEIRNTHNIFIVEPEGRDHSEELIVNVKIKLK